MTVTAKTWNFAKTFKKDKKLISLLNEINNLIKNKTFLN
jgi:hypothetical protein